MQRQAKLAGEEDVAEAVAAERIGVVRHPSILGRRAWGLLWGGFRSHFARALRPKVTFLRTLGIHARPMSIGDHDGG